MNRQGPIAIATQSINKINLATWQLNFDNRLLEGRSMTSRDIDVHWYICALRGKRIGAFNLLTELDQSSNGEYSHETSSTVSRKYSWEENVAKEEEVRRGVRELFPYFLHVKKFFNERDILEIVRLNHFPMPPMWNSWSNVWSSPQINADHPPHRRTILLINKTCRRYNCT